jgi:hypothetical protein
MGLYLITNGATQTTAALVPVTTGTVIKTMLQVKLNNSANGTGKIVEWGVSFDGAAAATPGRVELFACTGAATVTAHVAAGIINLTDPNAAAATTGFPFEFTTTTTGYTASSEGSAAAVRNLDAPQFIAPTTQYQKQFPLGREPQFKGTELVRIRVTFAAAVNCYCYVIVEA